MSENVMLFLNDRIETLGVCDLCDREGWTIAGINLLSEMIGSDCYKSLPAHSIAIISVGLKEIPFLTSSFLAHYRHATKTCLLLRGDVEIEDIRSFKHRFHCILRSSDPTDEILGALKLVANGYYVTGFAFDNQDEPDIPRHENAPDCSVLSDRELEISRQLARGMSNKEIALKLDISANTVNAHLASVRQKLDLRNRTEIALWVQKAS